MFWEESGIGSKVIGPLFNFVILAMHHQVILSFFFSFFLFFSLLSGYSLFRSVIYKLHTTSIPGSTITLL